MRKVFGPRELTIRRHVPHRVSAPPVIALVRVRSMDQFRVMKVALAGTDGEIDGFAFIELVLLDLRTEYFVFAGYAFVV